MSPFMIWVTENIGLLLLTGMAVAVALVAVGAIGIWRVLRSRTGPPRPIARFAFSLLLLGAGAGAALFVASGLRAMGPGLAFQRGLLGEPAPELRFALVESNATASLGAYRGQVVLLNVWATWCPPCRAEMDELDRLQRDYVDEGLVVVCLSDEERATLLDWVAERPADVVHAYARPLPWPDTGRPTTYVLDREGVIRRVLLGQRTYEQFENEIRRHL